MVESLLLHGHSALSTTLSPTVASWCELPVSCADIGSTQESNGTASPSSVSCPQVTHSAISPQVQADPTRIVTSVVTSPRRTRSQTPPYFWTQRRRLFHTSLSLRTFPPNSRSRSSLSWMHLPGRSFGWLGPTFGT